jgi:FHA domain
MARLLIKTDGAQVQILELRAGLNRLGRSPTNDFQIEHPTISTHHCEIVQEGDSVLVRDLGSTNGTYIDGRRVQEAILEIGQALRLGELELMLEAPPARVAIPVFDAPKDAAPVILPDGSVSCLNHSEKPASQKCAHCQRIFCEACVHHLRRVGGKFLDLCPVCSGPCEPIAGVAKPKKKSLWQLLQKTLKLPSKD